MKGTHPGLIYRTMQKFGFAQGIKMLYQFNSGKDPVITLPSTEHPFRMRKNSSDLHIFYAIFLLGEYDIPLAQRPRTIIDGGANMGLFTIHMKRSYPDAQVICVEPDNDNFALLQQNLSPYHDISFENSGLWHKDTRLKVYDKYNEGKWGMCVEEDPEGGAVEAITIKSLMNKYALETVDLLKLDIEGAEKYVFGPGAEEWLPKVKTIVIELHDRLEPGCAQGFFQAINQCYPLYNYQIRGEHTIVTNLSAY